MASQQCVSFFLFLFLLSICSLHRRVSLTAPRPVYPNGDVCISILHPPEDDKYGYESAAERWLPIHTVETILVSVISMLSSPNDSSPANIDAAVRSPARAPRFLCKSFLRIVYRRNGVRIGSSSRRRWRGQCGNLRRTCNSMPSAIPFIF